jgi:hypothetical protein
MTWSSSLEVDPVQNKPRTTLSGGALIGIIVAVAVLLCILCILVFFFVYLRWPDNSTATLSGSANGDSGEMSVMIDSAVTFDLTVLTEGSPLTLALTEDVLAYDP